MIQLAQTASLLLPLLPLLLLFGVVEGFDSLDLASVVLVEVSGHCRVEFKVNANSRFWVSVL